MIQHIMSKTVGKCLNGLLAKNSTQKMVYAPRFSEKGKRNKLKSSKIKILQVLVFKCLICLFSNLNIYA